MRGRLACGPKHLSLVCAAARAAPTATALPVRPRSSRERRGAPDRSAEASRRAGVDRSHGRPRGDANTAHSSSAFWWVIRLPPARSRVDLKLAHDGCNAASPAAGVDGGTILTAVTQPVRPPSLLVAESVRFARRVNAHQGQNRGLPAIRAAKPPRCPRRRLVPLSGAPGCCHDAVAGRSRCAQTVSLADGGDGVRAGIADGRYGNRDNPVTPGPPPGPPGSRSSPNAGLGKPRATSPHDIGNSAGAASAGQSPTVDRQSPHVAA